MEWSKTTEKFLIQMSLDAQYWRADFLEDDVMQKGGPIFRYLRSISVILLQTDHGSPLYDLSLQRVSNIFT